MEEKESKRLHAVGERVLTHVRQEKNKLQDANTQLGEELKDVRARLADYVKENKKLQGSIDMSILHQAFILIFIALWTVITHYVTILMPFLSYFTRFT